MRILIDGHVHLYPAYDWPKAAGSLLANLAGLKQPGRDQDPPLIIGLLTESRACRFYRDVAENKTTLQAGSLGLEPGGDAGSILIRDNNGIRGYLIAGRQIVTAEKLEILALGQDATIADGLAAEVALDAIRSTGAIPVLSWSPGKWFGRRGAIIRRLIETSAPDRFLIGDTGLRPTLWPLPRLMRLAQQHGFGIIGGSDALPLPGEEQWVGTYGVETQAEFDPTQPAASIRKILAAPETRFTPVGRRNGTLAFLSRWIRNQAARHSAKPMAYRQ